MTDVFSFPQMREIGALYVDKTADVWRMVNDSCGRTFFLSRPRWFGKSLLLSTFKAFFQGRRDLFKGLKIDSLAPDEAWQEYPILDMTMTRADDRDPARIESSLIQMVDELASRYGVAIQGVAPRDRFNSLILELVAKTKKPVVILIDEYDKPILDVIGTDSLDRTLEIMKSFYQVVKDRNADERFVFITGVTKFAHTSLFSGANNPTDLTARADFATLLGYTEEELKVNFAEEIEATAKARGVSVEQQLADMKEWYDGFRFEENSPSVYNPPPSGSSSPAAASSITTGTRPARRRSSWRRRSGVSSTRRASATSRSPRSPSTNTTPATSTRSCSWCRPDTSPSAARNRSA